MNNKVNRVILHKCIIKNRNTNKVIFNIDNHLDSFISVIYDFENAMGYNYVPIFSGSEIVQSIPGGLGNTFIYALNHPADLHIRNITIGEGVNAKHIDLKSAFSNINKWIGNVATTLNNKLADYGMTDRGRVGTNLYGYYFPKIWTGINNRVSIGLNIQMQANKDTKEETYKVYKLLRENFQLKYIGEDFPDFYLYTDNSNTFFFNNEILRVQLVSADFEGKNPDFSKPITSENRFPMFLNIKLNFELVSVYVPTVNIDKGNKKNSGVEDIFNSNFANKVKNIIHN